MKRACALALLVLLASCSSVDKTNADRHDQGGTAHDVGVSDGSQLDQGATTIVTCRESGSTASFDAARASRGYDLLTSEVLGRGIIPALGLSSLWVVWGTGMLTGEAYWAEFRARYGFHEAPFDNGELPMGFRAAPGGTVAVTCLGCHAGVVAGSPIVGAANTTVDYESLYDDLVRLNEVAPTYGFPSFEIPFDLDGLTGAAGVHDAMGLAMRMSTAYAGGAGAPNTSFGFQRSPAWWTVARKDRIYTDGIGESGGHRTMMAMLLAFGMTLAELQAMDEEIEDISHYILSLETPCWNLTDLDPELVRAGQGIFDAECASCHREPLIEDVGTDPVRAAQWGAAETTWVNASWFGAPPFTDSGGYLAQPLNGIWARAPYFHNGSVPDLAGVLDPARRPAAWRRTGSSVEDYDAEAVGWRFEVVDEPPAGDTQAGRLVYDTRRPGMSNVGHNYGAGLDEGERAALLEYLRAL